MRFGMGSGVEEIIFGFDGGAGDGCIFAWRGVRKVWLRIGGFWQGRFGLVWLDSVRCIMAWQLWRGVFPSGLLRHGSVRQAGGAFRFHGMVWQVRMRGYSRLI